MDTTTTLQDKAIEVLDALLAAKVAAERIGWVTNGDDDWDLGGSIRREIDRAYRLTMGDLQVAADRDYVEGTR